MNMAYAFRISRITTYKPSWAVDRHLFPSTSCVKRELSALHRAVDARTTFRLAAGGSLRRMRRYLPTAASAVMNALRFRGDNNVGEVGEIHRLATSPEDSDQFGPGECENAR